MLEISQEVAGVCCSLMEALECYLEVAGAYWRFLEALEQAQMYGLFQSKILFEFLMTSIAKKWQYMFLCLYKQP